MDKSFDEIEAVNDLIGNADPVDPIETVIWVMARLGEELRVAIHAANKIGQPSTDYDNHQKLLLRIEAAGKAVERYGESAVKLIEISYQ